MPVADEGVVALVATAVELIPPKLRAIGCPVREILARVTDHTSRRRSVDLPQQRTRLGGRRRHWRAGCRRRIQPGRRFARATGARVLPEQLSEKLLRTARAGVQPVAQHEHDDQNADAANPPQIPSSFSNAIHDTLSAADEICHKTQQQAKLLNVCGPQKSRPS
jgi:hypothetical protein